MDIMDTRAKILEEVDLGKVERLENRIEMLQEKLDRVFTPSSWISSLSRPRDIEKILPMPLMHPGVWTEFINRFGPNLREASNEKVDLSIDQRYEETNTKPLEQLLKDCK